MKRLSLIIIALLAFGQMAWAQTTIDLSTVTTSITVEDGTTLTGTLNTNPNDGNYRKISIAEGATITLSGVTIDCPQHTSQYYNPHAGLSCIGNATIVLAEGTTNNVKGFVSSYPGIFVPSGKTLTIRGTGTLNASSRGYGPGIGGVSYSGNQSEVHCGNIVIEDGIINATGGSGSAGIGGGYYCQWGNITITGGTITATGGYGAAAIGNGRSSGAGGTITITSGINSIYATKGEDSQYCIGAGTVIICGVEGSITTSPCDMWKYYIHFDANGGSGTMDDMTVMHDVPAPLSDNAYTRPGYFFLGWNTEADGNGTWYASQQSVTNLANTPGATATLYAQWSNGDLSLTLNDITVPDGMTLTGTLSSNIKVSIADGATVTLNNVTINGVNNESYPWAGLNCEGDAIIILADGTTNTIKGFYGDYPGIHVKQNYTLTIRGNGSLNSRSNGLAAGIGGGYAIPSGNINIAGGTITATGGKYAAGIGGARSTTCGDITITGGTITATGGQYAAGIGAGDDCNVGNITITTGITTLTATKGASNDNSSIGEGDYNSSCGTVTIGCTLDEFGNPVGGAIGQVTTSPVTYYSYTVAFDANGGTGTAMADTRMLSRVNYTLNANTYTREGYIFIGWNTAQDGSGTWYNNQQSVNNLASSQGETVTLYAQWFDGDLATLDHSVTIPNGMTLTGTLGSNVKVSIADGATVTINNVTINGTNSSSYNWAALNCEGDATIVLANGSTNTLTGFYENYPGIHVPSGKTLTIQGAGSLDASSNGKGAGIGGGYNINCGNITINQNVTKITATAGTGAKSIGAGQNGTCGTVTIGNGHVGEISTSPFNYFHYTITYNANGGTGTMASENVENGFAHTLAANIFTNGDKVFIGWTTESDGSGTYYNDQQTVVDLSLAPGGTLTLYALWFDGDISKLRNNFTATDGMTLTGTLGSNVKISIADGATVTLNNVTINGVNGNNYTWAGLNCEGDATIILADGSTNYLKGFHNNYPGLHVPANKTLTIQGNGSLTADNNSWGSGIGGGRNIACGNIVINGGTINAVGHSNSAGIGAGDGSTCGNILITGGNITASSPLNAAGIGGSRDGICGNITITKGITKVTASKANVASFSSIGKGRDGSCGTVTIGCTLDEYGNPVGGNVGEVTAQSVTYYTYSIAFDANGGNGDMANQSLFSGIAENLSANTFTRENCVFVSWNKEADGSGNTYTDQQSVNNLASTPGATVTLYAQWDLSPDYFDSTGEGTEADPYKITTITELNHLAKLVNNGTHDFSGKYFKLMNDLEYTYTGTSNENNYTAIGNSTHPFLGHFNGDLKTISGIRIYTSNSYQGLFGYIGNNSEVKNITIEDANIRGSQYNGGIVGYNDGGSLSDNFVFETTVANSSNNNHGAIAGYNNGGTFARNYYHNCTVAGTANANNKGCANANIEANDGAISAFTISDIDDFTVTADVTFTKNTTDYYKYGTIVTVSYDHQMPGYKYSYTVNGSAIEGNSFGISANVTTITTVATFIDWTTEYEGTEDDPYLIGNSAQWDILATNVNDGEPYICKYFKLTADISVTTSLGSNSTTSSFKYFSGNFDGAGHTLNVTYSGSGDCIAPFTCINNATIRNLHITGSITTTGMRPASIASFVNGDCTIANCWSEVAITSSRNADIDAGGLVARVNKTQSVIITDCLFSGSVVYSHSDGYQGGGMVGWTQDNATAKLANCLFAPTTITVKLDNDSYVFVSGEERGTLDNCYYNFVANACNLKKESSGIYVSDMSNEELRAALGDGWEIKNNKVVPIMTSYEFSGEGTSESPYLITSVTDWNGLADNVYLGYSYSGKHFKMTENVSSVTRMVGASVGDSKRTFNGTFDGDDNVLSVNYNVTSFSGSSTSTAAPFAFVDGATIKNLQITGSIATVGMRPASVIGFAHGDCTITDCRSNVAISSSYNADIDAGGFVARVDANQTLTLNGCAFTGSITYSNAGGREGGGMVGYTQSGATATLNNCYFTPSAISIINYNGHYRFVGGQVRGTLTNCYYNNVAAEATSLTNDGGTRAYSITTTNEKISIEMVGTASSETTIGVIGYQSGYAPVGIKYNGVLYAGNGETVLLYLNYSEIGYNVTYYANGEELSQTLDNYQLVMPNENVVITAVANVTPWGGGDGSSWDEAYEIRYQTQWKLLADRVNGTNGETQNSYSGKYFKLVDDIEYTYTGSANENNYTPIGNLDYHFEGHLDGQNHTVSGIRIYKGGGNTSDNNYKGLFGYIGEGGEVKNLKLEDSDITGFQYIGGIAGHNDGTISYCEVTSSVHVGSVYNASPHHGGIAGYNVGIISHCISSATLTHSAQFGCISFGGIAGENSSDGQITDNLAIGVTVPIALSGYGYGAILGNNDGGVMARNYYVGCTVADVENATGVGCYYTDVTANDGAVPGNVRSITGYGDNDGNWAFIASPIEGDLNPTTISGLIGTQTGEVYNYDLFQYNPLADLEWENYEQAGDHYHFNMTNGKGYLYAKQSNVTLKFIGETYNTASTEELELQQGFNLIGNPFPRAAWIDRSYYVMNDEGTNIDPVLVTATTAISPCTGVVVEATNADEKVTFTTTAPDAQSAANNNGSLAMTLVKGDINTRDAKVQDKAIVSFNEGTELGKFIFNENNAKLYIPQNGDDYAIAYSDRTGEMPLYFKANETGTYTITFDGDDMNGVKLIDKFENVTVDLGKDARPCVSTYTFTASSADRYDRFVLVFDNAYNANGSEADIFAYQNGSDIIVSGEGELQVFDVMGRMIAKQYVNGIRTHCVCPSGTGVYILKLNGKTQKIIIR